AVSTSLGAIAAARRSRWTYRWTAGVLLALVATSAWGRMRVAASELTRAGEPVRVGLVQGNVDQAEKWNDQRAAAIVSSYLRMTREAIAKGADLVLWPESATPF